MTQLTRPYLYQEGCKVVEQFRAENELAPVDISATTSDDWRVGSCAYYRKDQIRICIELCAPVGRAARAWSWPGYVVDRTPYGVVAHEMGHHMDYHKSKKKGAYFGDFSVALRGRTGEKPITTYAPNDAEWFAEIARLFITNPDLLRLIRPRTYKELVRLYKPVFVCSWEERLNGAPARTIRAALNKIEAARE